MSVIKWIAARLGFYTPESKPAPELSCFVRGLIRSLNESPEKWVITGDAIIHGDSPVWVWDNECLEFKISGAGEVPLTKHEIAALRVACQTLRDKGPSQVRQTFERLACPDSTPNP